MKQQERRSQFALLNLRDEADTDTANSRNCKGPVVERWLPRSSRAHQRRHSVTALPAEARATAAPPIGRRKSAGAIPGIEIARKRAP